MEEGPLLAESSLLARDRIRPEAKIFMPCLTFRALKTNLTFPQSSRVCRTHSERGTETTLATQRQLVPIGQIYSA
jgi:hypothetical protein